MDHTPTVTKKVVSVFVRFRTSVSRELVPHENKKKLEGSLMPSTSELNVLKAPNNNKGCDLTYQKPNDQ
jgi:hypothetical protein